MIYTIKVYIRYGTECKDVLVWDDDKKLGLGVTSVTIIPKEYKLLDNLERLPYDNTFASFVAENNDDKIKEFVKNRVIEVLADSKNECLSDPSFIINEYGKYNLKDDLQLSDITVEITTNGLRCLNYIIKLKNRNKAHYDLCLDDIEDIYGGGW